MELLLCERGVLVDCAGEGGEGCAYLALQCWAWGRGAGKVVEVAAEGGGLPEGGVEEIILWEDQRC